MRKYVIKIIKSVWILLCYVTAFIIAEELNINIHPWENLFVYLLIPTIIIVLGEGLIDKLNKNRE